MSSLLNSLAKVAVGMAVAKGVQSMSGGSRRQAGGGLESILGQLSQASGGASAGAGGLGDILGGLAGASGGAQGGLGDLLGGLANAKGGSQGGLGDILGGLAGAAGGSKGGAPDLGGILGTVLAGAGGAVGSGQLGGLGGLLDGLAGGSAGRLGTGSGGLGDLLNQSLDSFGAAEVKPSADQEDAARYLLVAMLEAAKSDGEIDASEKKALMDAMADASASDQAFVQEILSRPIDVDAIVKNLPDDMYEQAYAMSLIAIDLNNKAEAQHLHSLASAMGISQAEVNAIHGQMGEPALYA